MDMTTPLSNKQTPCRKTAISLTRKPRRPVRAVQIAQHVDGPVKVVGTREEDIQHDMYRPYWFDRISAGLDDMGMPVAWSHRFAGLLGDCAVGPAVLPEWSRSRHDRRRDRSGVCPSEHARRLCAGRVPWHSECFLAQRRALAQCLRRRKLMDELATAALSATRLPMCDAEHAERHPHQVPLSRRATDAARPPPADGQVPSHACRLRRRAIPNRSPQAEKIRS